MWQIILIAVVAIILVFVVVVAMQPCDFRVSRSAIMSAPPDVVFDQVNSFKKWEAWSPWAKMDPNAKTTYSGPAEGVGASFTWSGNRAVGQGRMTNIESRPCELIRLQLDFEKPMKGTNLAEFTFKLDGQKTAVCWTMTGKYNFVGKAANLIINCDKMVGEQFEKGLADMKTLAETAAGKCA